MGGAVMPYIIGGVVALLCAVIGFISGSVYRRKSAESTIGSAEDEARRILSDAMKNAEQRKKKLCLKQRMKFTIYVRKPKKI